MSQPIYAFVGVYVSPSFAKPEDARRDPFAIGERGLTPRASPSPVSAAEEVMP